MRVRGVLEYAGVERIGIRCGCLRMFIHFDVGMVWNHFPGERKMIEGRCDRSSLVLRASCWNEQTRVAQVGERSETVRVECNDDCCGST